MNTAREEIYRGCTIRLVYDEDAENPRKWCNVGTMACWHSRYTLGDIMSDNDQDCFLSSLAIKADPLIEDMSDERDATDDASVIESFNKRRAEVLSNHYIMLPLYLYDHSGITMSTEPFSCQWDSGQVGFIYCAMERARKEWTGTDAEIRAKAEAYLRGEVEIYDAYLTGQVVGYIAEDPRGIEIGSCWGYYPEGDNYAYAISEARSAIDCWHEEQDTETAERTYWEEREVITKG